MTIPTARKEIGELIEVAKAAGFTLERYTGSGHYKMRHGNGECIVIPSTPRGSRWKKKALADMRRAIRKGNA